MFTLLAAKQRAAAGRSDSVPPYPQSQYRGDKEREVRLAVARKMQNGNKTAKDLYEEERFEQEVREGKATLERDYMDWVTRDNGWLGGYIFAGATTFDCCKEDVTRRYIQQREKASYFRRKLFALATQGPRTPEDGRLMYQYLVEPVLQSLTLLHRYKTRRLSYKDPTVVIETRKSDLDPNALISGLTKDTCPPELVYQTTDQIGRPVVEIPDLRTPLGLQGAMNPWMRDDADTLAEVEMIVDRMRAAEDDKPAPVDDPQTGAAGPGGVLPEASVKAEEEEDKGGAQVGAVDGPADNGGSQGAEAVSAVST